MQVSDYNAGPWTGTGNVAGRGTPSRAKGWSCLSLRNELSEESHVLTTQETLLGRGAWVDRSLGFYGDGVSFRVVSDQSF